MATNYKVARNVPPNVRTQTKRRKTWTCYSYLRKLANSGLNILVARKSLQPAMCGISGRSPLVSQHEVKQYNGIILHDMHNSPRYSKRAACTPLFGLSIVAVMLLIIMGCLVQAIREALAAEVSVEIGKPISLLSNRALGPVLHSLIQMRVSRTGLAKLIQPPPPNSSTPTPPSLTCTKTYT